MREGRIPMNEKQFQELLQGVREAGAYMRGDRSIRVKVDAFKPDSVTAIRAKMRLSQSQFSEALGVSRGTLRNWEQGRREPTGAAKLLLKVAANHPRVVLEAARELAAA